MSQIAREIAIALCARDKQEHLTKNLRNGQPCIQHSRDGQIAEDVLVKLHIPRPIE